MVFVCIFKIDEENYLLSNNSFSEPNTNEQLIHCQELAKLNILLSFPKCLFYDKYNIVFSIERYHTTKPSHAYVIDLSNFQT